MLREPANVPLHRLLLLARESQVLGPEARSLAQLDEEIPRGHLEARGETADITHGWVDGAALDATDVRLGGRLPIQPRVLREFRLREASQLPQQLHFRRESGDSCLEYPA